MKKASGPIRLLAVLAVSALTASQLFTLTGCGSRAMDRGRTAVTGASEAADSRSVIRRSVGLTVWSPEEDQPMLRRQCDAFCASYPDADITVTLRPMSTADAAEAAGRDPQNAADVFAVRGSALRGLVRSGAVGENSLTADSVTGRFSSDDLSAAIVDGRLYGYPCYSDACILYYDSSRLSGSDAASLEGLAERIREVNGRAGKGDRSVCPFAADFSGTDMAASVFLTSGYGAGQTPPDSADGFDFGSDESLEAARYIASLERLGAEDMDPETAASRFRAGTLASYAAGSEYAGAMKSALGEHYAAAELPSISIGGGDRHLMGFSDSVMYAVKATTAHPQEAAALADYLTGDQCMLDRLAKRELLPAGSRMSKHPSVRDGSAAAAVREQLGHNVVSPAEDAMEDIWRPAAQLGRELFGGKVGDGDIGGRLGRLSGRRAA